MAELSELKNGINSRAEIENMCGFHAQELLLPDEIDKKIFLIALSGVESSFGRNNVPRFELGFSKSSLAYKRSEMLQEGYELYGDLCAQSYGPWQILWINARQLGYPLERSPLELTHGEVSIAYVVELLNSFVKYQARTLEDYFASYNAGPGCLVNKKIWPMKYTKKAIGIYNDLKQNT